MSIYIKNNIYSNVDLTSFFHDLEIKYNIKKKDEFRNGVNFSQNKDVSFHQWFKYREGFSGTLINTLISRANLNEGDIVIDPFAGSGTTLVAAKENNLSGYGMDVNPISVLLSNVKTYNYTHMDLELIDDYIDSFNEQYTKGFDSLRKEIIGIKIYFNDNNFEALLGIREFIDNIDNKMVKDFFMTAFVSIIEDVSDRKRDGNGLRIEKSKIEDVQLFYKNKLNQMFNDVMYKLNYQNIISNNEIYIENDLASATNLSTLFKKSKVFDNNKKRTIIFSPPYPNSFDYFESYKMELVFSGYSKNIKDIKKYRSNAVRSFVGGEHEESYDPYVDMIAEEIEAAIVPKEKRTGKRDSRTRKVPVMIKGYFADMWEILRECNKSLKDGDLTYIVVDQSSYLGIIVPTDLLLAYFAEKSGFEVVNILEARKARTSPQQMNQFPYLKNGLRESIIELRKIKEI